jgi:hypothetical protein
LDVQKAFFPRSSQALPVGGLHMLRGRVLEVHGHCTDALYDLQFAATLGVAEAAAEASASSPRVEMAERENFTALNKLKQLFIRNRPASERSVSRLLKEWRFEHVHHSTAIERNPLPDLTVRALLETRLVSGAPQHFDAYLEVLGTDEALQHVIRCSNFNHISSLDAWDRGLTTATPPSE